MGENTVRSFGDLETLIRKKFDRSDFIYRGVRDGRHGLRPTIGRRVDGYQPYSTSRERALLERFKQFAALHVPVLPRNDWEWLALAQHHGLSTRLLDWTFNPLVAAWFALKAQYSSVQPRHRTKEPWRDPHQKPPVLYARKMPRWVDTTKNPDPFKVKKVVSFLPPHVSRRITAQSGLFTAHPEPDIDWEGKGVYRIVLEMEEDAWRDATRILLRTGVTQYSLFPDLDGLAANLSMLYVRNFNLAYGPAAELEEKEGGSV